jgi:hypothetical protein
MVHGVFALMICQIAVLSTLRFLLVVSADGSWSVCTHEHLTDRCSLTLFATALVMSADGSWVFALMNI